MFLLLDIRGTGFGAENFARALLEHEGVATFPCDGFVPLGAVRDNLPMPSNLLAASALGRIRRDRPPQ